MTGGRGQRPRISFRGTVVRGAPQNAPRRPPDAQGTLAPSKAFRGP